MNLVGVSELVYGKIIYIDGCRLSLRCYTTINPSGESRDCGSDAIRFQLFDKVGDEIFPVGKPTKCLRVEGWRDNLTKAIDRIEHPDEFHKCAKCGHPQVLRKSSTGKEFWGCSTFKFTQCKGY